MKTFPPSCRFHFQSLATSIILFGLLICQLTQAAPRPNIVFIFSDDHAVQAISAYGSQINQTPHIDRLAREGALFTNSFCANSLCGPSRACILTGKHSHLNGFLRNGNRFDSNQTTFPPLMRQAGYQTAVIGKWHLGTDPVGFDYWEVLPGQGSYYNPVFLQMDGSRKRRQGYCTDLITDRSLTWLKEQRDPDKPFLLMCQHKAPHRNWSPAQRHFSLYQNEKIPEPETLHDDYANRSPLLQENEMTLRGHMHWAHDMKLHGENQFPKYFEDKHKNGEYRRMTDQQKQAWDAHYEPENQAFLQQMRARELTDEQILSWKYQRYIKDYLRSIAAVDDGVGRILDYLDESGLAENTLVIYSSDQGFYLGEHGWYDKRWMFEESLKMPFVARWPGKIAAGARPQALIQNIDYGPTFLEMAGVEVPAEMQGRSLLPVLQNEGLAEAEEQDNGRQAGAQIPAGWRDAIYYAYYENAAVHNVPVHDGVRTDRYKLMFFPRGLEWQLFDLQQDPQEMVSVHDDPAYADQLAGLKKRYQDLRAFYAVNTAVIPATRGDVPWWRQRDRAVTQRAKQGGVELAFIGDSITQGWEGGGKEIWKEFYGQRQPINLGFGGDRTEHVIWRLEHGNLADLTPKVAVLMIGTNNTGHLLQDPQEVAAGIGRILEILAEKTPKTQVILQAILPRGHSTLDPNRLNNVAINQRIRRFADGKRIHFLDLSNRFLEPDGSLSAKIMPDALHLSAEGYRRWAEGLEPKLKELGL
jgi:arylsulfatase A-like enzyme/lysophospholipase L1-like esterase